MEFLLANSAGFCSGVRKAVDITLNASAAKEGKISTLGPLVHNPQVIELLNHREVTCAENIEDIHEGLVIIRSHGVAPQVKLELDKVGLKYLDATCPKVGRAQAMASEYADAGYHVLILGEPEHAEVRGLKGYGGENCTVIQSAQDLDGLPRYEKVCLIAQTTQNLEEFELVTKCLTQLYPDVVIKNTICAATRKRQDEIRELAPRVNAMVVIGGRNSGNTKRLVHIARDECNLPTFWIETDEELEEIDFSPYIKIGVTAGASTPSWIIERVMHRLREMEERSKNPLVAKARRLVRVLVISHAYTSIAAGALCYLAGALLRIDFQFSFFALVFSYVLAMHVLNRFTESGADKFRDDPVRMQFYKDHGKVMLILGLASMLVSIALSFMIGVFAFFIILAASILGVIYSVKVVPKKFFSLFGFRRLKDIAASKNFFVASAWAVVSIFPLFFIQVQKHYGTTLAVFFFLFAATGVRSIYMDLSDIASDRLVGRDSVPIVIGEKNTRNLIRVFVVFEFVFMYMATFLNLFPTIGYIVSFWILIEFIIIEYLLPERTTRPSLAARDIMVDGHFILAGLVAWIWNFLQVNP